MQNSIRNFGGDFSALRPAAIPFQTSLSKVPLPEKSIPRLVYQTPSITLEDKVCVESIVEDPLIINFANFLTPQECEELIAFARGRLSASTIVPAEGDQYVPDASTRKSETAGMGFCETSLVSHIERKIARITNTTVEQGEYLQVIRYPVGGEYLPHYDYFSYSSGIDTFVHADRGGQRIATMIIYLNTVPDGGGTEFPKVGVRCAAIQGNACYFSYVDQQGNLDTRSLHAGLPVTEGEKWIAVKWIREIAHPH